MIDTAPSDQTPARDARAPLPLLLLRGISKTFPGVQALDNVDFTLRAGEIHALLGENGAGKSTLIKVLTGVYRQDRGEILLDGQPIAPRSPLAAQALGIHTVYQEINLIPHLSVAENIALGRAPRRLGLIRWSLVRQHAREALARLALDIDVTRPLSSYPVAIQQLVAIARVLCLGGELRDGPLACASGSVVPPRPLACASGSVVPPRPLACASGSVVPPRPLACASGSVRNSLLATHNSLLLRTPRSGGDTPHAGRPRVLILDEPTSSLDAAEVRRLFDVLRKLAAGGLGIVFITHFLDQVYQIATRLTVLRNGRLVGEYEPASLPRLELVAKMIGQDAVAALERSARHAAPQPASEPRASEMGCPPGRPLLRARRLGRRPAVHPLDLDIHAGEVVGLAGLLGSGRTETARLLFGLDRADSGTVEILVDRGKRVPSPMTSPRAAIRQGLGFCPEDRQTAGLVPDLSVRDNILLALQARRGWHRPLPRKARDALADRYLRALRIATPDLDRPVAQLSGGNQQKVILARWLAAEPRLLIVDEPTRGIDVGAKAEIERLLAELAAGGMAILFISSELEEVVRNCHRVAVLCDREKVGELTGAAVDQQAILQLIAGGAL